MQFKLLSSLLVTVCFLCDWAVPARAETKEIAALRAKAEKGDAEAQDDLGVMYYKGQGVPKNDAEAVKWFYKAAEQGNAGAQYDLGVMYDNGRGVPKSFGEARASHWYWVITSCWRRSARGAWGPSTRPNIVG